MCVKSSGAVHRYKGTRLWVYGTISYGVRRPIIESIQKGDCVYFYIDVKNMEMSFEPRPIDYSENTGNLGFYIYTDIFNHHNGMVNTFPEEEVKKIDDFGMDDEWKKLVDFWNNSESKKTYEEIWKTFNRGPTVFKRSSVYWKEIPGEDKWIVLKVDMSQGKAFILKHKEVSFGETSRIPFDISRGVELDTSKYSGLLNTGMFYPVSQDC